MIEVVIPFVVDHVWPAIVAIVKVLSVLLLLALLIYSIYNMVMAIRATVADRRPTAAPELHGESRISYWHHQMWKELRGFFGHHLKFATKGEQPIVGAAVTASMAWNLVAVILVALAAGLAWIWLGVMAAIDSTWILIRGLVAHCPHCHEKAFHLHYRCGSCSRMHRHLRVNRAGALHHTCVCGARIPSHVFTGRGGGRSARCVQCEGAIPQDLLQSRASFLALAGGPDSGKTTALVSVSRWMHEQLPRHGTRVELEDETQRVTMARWMRELPRGGMPDKTTGQRHRAFTFVLDPPRGRRRAIYAFDAPGEMFRRDPLQQAHTYFESAGAVLFALDPFSLEPLLRAMQGTSHWPEVLASSPSSMDPVDVASSLIRLFESNQARRRGEQFVAPVHVWITKTDVADLEPLLDLSEAELRDWLEKSGGGGLIRILESSFLTVRYFTASAADSPKARRRRNLAIKELAAALIPQERRQLEATN